MKHRIRPKLKWRANLARAMLIALILNMFPISTVYAASHAHTADCYTGTLHSHTDACYEDTTTACSSCGGTGVKCSAGTCDGTGYLYHNKTCTGTLTNKTETTYSDTACSTCGQLSSSSTDYLVCSSCGDKIAIAGYGGCGCGGGGNRIYPWCAAVSTANGTIHKEFVVECYDATQGNSQEIQCSTCNGTGVTSNCSTCGGDGHLGAACTGTLTQTGGGPEATAYSCGSCGTFVVKGVSPYANGSLHSVVQSVDCPDCGVVVTCGKNTTNYYDTSGNVCSPVCSQVVTSLAPTKTTQTVNAGTTPDWTATATFLDGTTKTVTCTPTGYSSTTYGTKQTITLSYGSYNGTAKTSGAKSTTVYVTVNGYFNLTVSSEDTNKGTVSGGGSKLAGSSVTVVATPKTGYSFVGWYEGSTKVSSNTSYTFTMSASAKTLQAKFSTNNYTLTRTSENTTMGTVSGSSGSVAYGTSVTVTAAANAGYTFSGWYEGSTKVSSNASYQFTMPAANKTLVAKFTSASYNVIFDSAGGTSCNAKSVTYNTAYGTLPTPTKTGYTFLGWYIGNTKIESTTVMTQTAAHTLTAKWSVNSYKLTLTDINGSAQEEYEYSYGATVTIDAGTKAASWFTGWSVVTGDGSSIDLSKDTMSFTMPAGDLILKANWNDVVSITSSFNQTLYDTYIGVYDETMDSFDIDLATQNKITIQKSMIDVWVVFEDGTRQAVADSNDFIIADNEIMTVGSSNVTITLNTITKADGTKFECSSTIKVHSASIDNVMADLGITTYKELANYISDIQSNYDTVLDEIGEYEAALEQYRELLNSAEGNDIVFDDDLTANLGRIEVGIQTVLDRINGYKSDISLIQSALINAGEGLGPEFDVADGELSTILTQITALKTEIDTLRTSCADLTAFCNDLKSLIGLDSSASLQDIYDAIDALKNDLAAAKDSISDYSAAITDINNDIYGDTGITGDMLEDLLNATSGVGDIKDSLANMNSQLSDLLAKTELILTGSSNPSNIYEATNINTELEDLQQYLTKLRQDLDEANSLADSLKVILNLDSSSGLQDILDAVTELKEKLEETEGEANAYSEAIDIILRELYGGVDDTMTLHERLASAISGMTEAKTEVADINKQLLELINKTNGILSGTILPEEEYLASDLEQQLIDLETYLNQVTTNIDETILFVDQLKALLDIDSNASLQEILNKVSEQKNKMEVAENQVAQYESALEDVFEKLGLGGDISGDLSEDLDNALNGLDSVRLSIEDIDMEVYQMIEQLSPLLDENNTSITAVTGSAIDVVITDLETDIKTLKDYLNDVLDFAEEVISLFGMESENGSLTLEAVLGNLTTIKQEYDMYTEMIVQLESLTSTGEIEETDLASQLSALYSRIDSLKQQLEATDNMLDEEFGEDLELSDVKTAISDLKSELAAALTTITELRDNNLSKDIIIEEQQNEIQSLNGQIVTLEERLLSKESVVKEQQEEITLLNTQITDLESAVLSKDEEIEALKAEIESLKKNSSGSSSVSSSLSSTIISQTAEIKELSATVEEKNTEIEMLKTDAETKDDKIKELESDVLEKDTELETLKTENESITAKVETLEAQVAILKNTVSESNPAPDTSAFETTIASQETTIKELNDELTAANSTIETLSKEVEALKTEAVAPITPTPAPTVTPSTSEELQETNEKILLLETELNDVEKEVLELNKVIEQNNLELEQLRSDNEALQASEQSAKERYKELVTELTKIKNDAVTTNKTTTSAQDVSYYTTTANTYDGVYLANEEDSFAQILDSTTEGNRVIYIDTWTTSDGMLLSENGYMLSFFTDYAWGNSLDILQTQRSNDDNPITLHDVMLYEINMTTGEYVTIVISNVNYIP